ncbi:SPOR domain-containing protein [Nonlabens sp. MB-3u-79]|uniref:HU domain-containing protein n=1 Tax=Nonlabens sp. MB-3u-79 TaxID=2058134 RepID=UPI0018E2856D|nr:SPOR domain-containing protein [Nonlabens sp. MB-3u-79]
MQTYISDLLYRQECVVIPDFGAFISRRVPAQHFASSHTIYPPKKGLSFNAQIKQNDGLLANYVASAAHLSYEEAVQEIRNYVRFLDQEIDDNGSITIHKVGRFSRNEEKALQFTPMYLVNYLPEAFGLSSHETFAIDRIPVAPEVVSNKELSDDVPVAVLEIPNTNYGSWVRYAAVGAVLLGLSYAGFSGYVEQVEKDALVVNQMADELVDAKIESASFLISDPLPRININVAPLERTYHVVAGAFRISENADKRVAQLKRKGFDAKRIGVNKYGLHNVAFSSFVERNDAINELHKLRALGFDKAWLFTGKLPK